MRFFLILSIVCAFVMSGLYGFGANLSSHHKFTEKMTYDADIAVIWDRVSNYENLAVWDANVTKIEPQPAVDELPVWRLYDPRGEFMDVQIVQQKEPYLHVSRIINSSYPFTGSWVIELLKIEDNQTIVTLTEEGNIESPFWRVVMRFVIGLDKGAKQFLSAIGFSLLDDVEEPADTQETEGSDGIDEGKKDAVDDKEPEVEKVGSEPKDEKKAEVKSEEQVAEKKDAPTKSDEKSTVPSEKDAPVIDKPLAPKVDDGDALLKEEESTRKFFGKSKK